jgi:hypothetical protein
MSHVKPERQKWFDVACCPTNVARTLASLGQYIYSVNQDSLFVNLWIQNETKTEINGESVSIRMDTDFPRHSKIHLSLKANGTSEFRICLRIPEYAENYAVIINGSHTDYSVQKNYACIAKRWKNEDMVISFDMPAKLISANPFVRADSNKVAIMRGPEVFCLEETDNFPNLRSVIIERSAALKESYDENLFGGTTIIRCEAEKISEKNWRKSELYKAVRPEFEKVSLTAVPYAYWCNRKPGEMIVWINAKT